MTAKKLTLRLTAPHPADGSQYVDLEVETLGGKMFCVTEIIGLLSRFPQLTISIAPDE